MSLIHSFAPLTRACTPLLFRLQFKPPVGDRFASRDSSAPGLGHLGVFIALPPRGRRIYASFPFRETRSKHGLTLGTVYVVPSVVTSGPLRLPCARNAPLAGVTQLEARLPPVESGRNAGVSGPLSRHLSLHAADLTPGPQSVQTPFASQPAMAFPFNVEGRRVSCTTRFIPQPAAPSYSRPVSGYGAASFVFLLQPADLACAPDWVVPPCSAGQLFAAHCRGKFRPVVTSRTRPQPTYPKGPLV